VGLADPAHGLHPKGRRQAAPANAAALANLAEQIKAATAAFAAAAGLAGAGRGKLHCVLCRESAAAGIGARGQTGHNLPRAADYYRLYRLCVAGP